MFNIQQNIIWVFRNIFCWPISGMNQSELIAWEYFANDGTCER